MLLRPILSLTLAGCNGDGSCCTSSNRCGIGEGDCDEDNDCYGSLVCNNDLNNCAWGGNDDCCTPAKPLHVPGNANKLTALINIT